MNYCVNCMNSIIKYSGNGYYCWCSKYNKEVRFYEKGCQEHKWVKFIKSLSVLLCLFYGLSVCFASDTYYLTQEQLNELIVQINNLQSNNNDMKLLLESQKNEFQILEKNYLEQYLTMKKQQQNSKELLSRYESRESIYKYSIIGALVAGLLVGIIIAK